MSSLLDGSIWAVTPNLERSTGATNAELNKINKKTIEGPPYGPYIAERNPTANSQLQIPRCLGLFDWGSDEKIRLTEFQKFYYELFWWFPLLTWPTASLLIINYVCSAIFAFTKLGSLKHNMSIHGVLYEHAFFVSLNSYYRKNLKKKIMHSTTFNPAGLEAMYAAESMLPLSPLSVVLYWNGTFFLN